MLNAIAAKLPELIGGSADLALSNNSIIKSSHDFQKGSNDGRNLRFGVREHALAAILSGMALHKGLRPYGGTIHVFADYMRPAIRLAALMKLPVIYIFTHDSIAVSEDGATHHPVEYLASLRAIPGLRVIRPANAVETAAAWRVALQTTDGPVALVLSLPSWEVFEAQPRDCRVAVLPPAVTCRVAVEAGIAMGWERYTGVGGAFVGMTRFGASAPGGVVMEKFGFTAENVAVRALALLGRELTASSPSDRIRIGKIDANEMLNAAGGG